MILSEVDKNELCYPRFFYLSLICFLGTSFIGQGVSYGKVYLSHLFLIPCIVSMFLERKWLIKFFEKKLLWIALPFFLYVCGSVFLDIHSLKFVVIYVFGFIQYFFMETSPRNLKESILKLIFCLFLVDLGIGLCEAFEIFRFPISDLNPDVSYFGKKSSFYFGEFVGNEASYLHSAPTGLRWNANTYIFSISIVLLFVLYKVKKWWIVPLTAVCIFLSVAASSRYLFWLMPLFMIPSLLKQSNKVRLGILFFYVTIPLLTFFLGNHSLKNKAIECMEFPVRIMAKITNFESQVVRTVPLSFQSTANRLPSETHRYNSFIRGFNMFKSRPIIGHGAGGSSYDSVNKVKDSCHFYLLEILVDFGLIGFLFYCSWLCYPVFQAYQNNREIKYFATSVTLFFMIGSIAVSSLIYNPIYYLALGYIHSEIWSLGNQK